ncbi:hypothetical protein [Aureimonas sp. AU12]|uniref:hypothetical protein n=1 Tax=Aureimonas sp. AU12 TaxID=1638161 RepID=UPI0007845315|nr:hypothetical protein [Aureimonas sp. AU12]
MSRTAATGGVSLTTALQTLVTNTAADAKVRTYVIDFLNIKPANATVDPDVTQCVLIDVSASNVSRPILPTNATVKKRDALSRTIILDPGDSIQAAASESSGVYALVQKKFEEQA